LPGLRSEERATREGDAPKRPESEREIWPERRDAAARGRPGILGIPCGAGLLLVLRNDQPGMPVLGVQAEDHLPPSRP
jgi:hypothetical protein